MKFPVAVGSTLLESIEAGAKNRINNGSAAEGIMAPCLTFRMLCESNDVSLVHDWAISEEYPKSMTKASSDFCLKSRWA